MAMSPCIELSALDPVQYLLLHGWQLELGIL
jgi:hypothetical protein